MYGSRMSWSNAMTVGSGSVGFLTYSEDLKFCGPQGTTVTFDISTGSPVSPAPSLTSVSQY